MPRGKGGSGQEGFSLELILRGLHFFPALNQALIQAVLLAPMFPLPEGDCIDLFWHFTGSPEAHYLYQPWRWWGARTKAGQEPRQPLWRLLVWVESVLIWLLLIDNMGACLLEGLSALSLTSSQGDSRFHAWVVLNPETTQVSSKLLGFCTWTYVHVTTSCEWRMSRDTVM